MASLLEIAGIDHRVVDGPARGARLPGRRPPRGASRAPRARPGGAGAHSTTPAPCRGCGRRSPTGRSRATSGWRWWTPCPGSTAPRAPTCRRCSAARSASTSTAGPVPVLTLEQQLVVACAELSLTPVPSLVALRDVAQLALAPGSRRAAPPAAWPTRRRRVRGPRGRDGAGVDVVRPRRQDRAVGVGAAPVGAAGRPHRGPALRRPPPGSVWPSGCSVGGRPRPLPWRPPPAPRRPHPCRARRGRPATPSPSPRPPRGTRGRTARPGDPDDNPRPAGWHARVPRRPAVLPPCQAAARAGHRPPGAVVRARRADQRAAGAPVRGRGRRAPRRAPRRGGRRRAPPG